MFSFSWPWLFALLPLPLLIRYLFPPLVHTQAAALRVPFLDDFSAFSGQQQQLLSDYLRAFLLFCAWLFLVAAAARPVWVGEPVEINRSGRDLMLAMDLSGSMKIADFQFKNQRLDRLTATKWVAGEFVKRREGDRLGLILFGDQAYLQTPLTFDRETVNRLLQEAALGLAGERTAIGDAIGLAVKRLRKQESKDQVLILMTDGANTAGRVSPLEAADMAQQEGLKIYTVGIGADARQQSFFGISVSRGGELDERTLKGIAESTGGRYFRAHNLQEFQQIYEELDRLEPVEKDSEVYRPQKELFNWFLLAFMTLFSVALLLKRGR